MNGPAYPAARVVAPKVREHLTRHPGAAHTTSIAATEVIEAVIDAAFWASLRREEGYVPKISLAILSPADGAQPLVFERALPLNPGSLVHVSPAVERPGLHLAVWPFDSNVRGVAQGRPFDSNVRGVAQGRPFDKQSGDELRVWGTVRAIPPACCVIEVAAPGLLVIKHRPPTHSGKFVNIAVVEGDQIKVVDERATRLADCPELVTSLLGFDAPTSAEDSVNVLVELAVSMRAHGRGGSLLVVPADSDVWRDSIVHPLKYSVSPGFVELADLMRVRPQERPGSWDAALGRAVEMIAGLTAVDGATVLTDDYALVAFGAKISRRDGNPRVEQVAVTEPIEGAVAETVHPGQLGGTRHLSAVQFVQDQRDAIALVASQDGRFTVFAWSPCDELVRAHRVETLLL